MNGYVQGVAAWGYRGGTEWDDEKRRAHLDGMIACQECGHEIKPAEGSHDEEGCHEFDHNLDFDTEGPCKCPLRLTNHDMAVIWRNYQMFPYIIGTRVFYCGDPDDPGVVVGFSDDGMALLISWEKSTKPVWEYDPISNLSAQPG